MIVDPTNTEALRAWDGDDGAYWAANEAIFDDSLARYRDVFFDACAIETADAVLDIGCGTGQATRDAARRATDGSALGIDLSSAMLDRARQRAADEGVTNCRFLQADAQVHPFEPASFDVAISRTGTMFFGDPEAAFTNIGRALRPGGRLAMFVWQALPLNHWIRDFATALAGDRALPVPPPGLPGPFSLADPDRVRSLLGGAGFDAVEHHGVEEPMYFGATAEEAYRFVRGLGFTEFQLRGLEQPAREAALDALRATIDAHATPDGVLYPSAAWIVTALASSAAGSTRPGG